MIRTAWDMTCHVEDCSPIYPNRFKSVMSFHDGIAAVEDESGAYHIDINGKEIYAKRFRKSFGYYEGVAAVEDDSGAYHIDVKGNCRYSERFFWVGNFNEKRCTVRFKEGDYGIIDDKGTVIFRNYMYVGDYSEGYTIVRSKKGCKHLDLNGGHLYEKWYCDCTNFCNGKAFVSDGNTYDIIDKKGIIVEKTNFKKIVSFSKDRLTAIDKDGRLIDNGKSRMSMCEPSVFNAPYPEWMKEITKHKWDSCAIFIRHGNRDPTSLSENRETKTESLNKDGKMNAKTIGERMRGIPAKEFVVHSSLVPRCIETADNIIEGFGRCDKKDSTEILGLPGTAFIFDVNGSDRTAKYPLMEETVRALRGETHDGWYPADVCVKNILDYLKDDLSVDGRVTVCVSHDAFVARMQAVLKHEFPLDSWVDFLNGIVIFRRGKEMFVDLNGTEKIIPDVFDCKDIEFTGESFDVIEWSGKENEGFTPFRDINGNCCFKDMSSWAITNEHFDYVGEMKYSVAVVGKKNHGMTFITDRGEYLLRKWFLECTPFHKGFACIRDNKGWYHIDMRGNALYEERYSYLEPFYNGKALCCDKNNEWKLLSLDGSTELLRGD